MISRAYARSTTVVDGMLTNTHRRVQVAKTDVREHDRRAEKRRGEERDAELHARYAASVYELLPSPMYDSYTCSNSALHFVWYVSFV